MTKKTNLLIVAFITFFMFSCDKDDDDPIENNLEISQEIKDLIYFKGDESSSIVLVNTQGGPGLELATNEFDDILKDVNTSNLLRVNVHQKQTLFPELFTNNEISFDDAIGYDTESVEMLYKVIKYFKDQNRTVYVLGISVGAFMAQQLIAEKGIDVADKYLIMVGRLDMNEEFWKGFSEGREGYFTDGDLPIVWETDQADVTDRNMLKLAGGLGKNRYTQKFASIESLSKITYVYGKKDDNVGKLSSDEIEFLQSKNVTTITGEGNHQETMEDYIVEGFKAAFGIE